MVLVAFLIAALVTAATLVKVYRGGTTLNDHFVAAVCAGCVGIYPLLWWGAVDVGLPAPALALLGVALAVGAFGIFGLFWVLDGRRDPGALVGLAYLSQPAFAFSLWTGLLYCFWFPGALVAGLLGVEGLHPLWPGAALLLPLALATWGTLWTYGRHNTVVVHRLDVPALRDRPVRLVQLSDLHASPCMTRAHLAEVVRRTNALNPDIVVVTGDLVMPFSEEEHGYLIDSLAELQAPVLCCPGNHDLPVTERLAEELAAIGADWLVDQSRTLTVGEHTLEVAGVDFHWKDAKGQLERAIPAMGAPPAAAYRVLLAHDPRLFNWVPEERFDLVLSGHTHGGQVGTDMFGVPWSVLRLPGFYDQGFFLRGRQRLYVHRGNWHTGLPPRMGIASEIVLFELGGVPA